MAEDTIERFMTRGAGDDPEHRDQNDCHSCDFCDKLAIANYQRLWHKWSIDEQGDYEEIVGFRSHLNDSPDGENNVHLCAAHEQQWLGGEI